MNKSARGEASARREGQWFRRRVSLRQAEHGERSAERGVVAQRGIAADGTQAVGRVGQTGREPDPGPSTDARENGDVLLAVVLVGRHVADDAGRGLELVELLAGL